MRIGSDGIQFELSQKDSKGLAHGAWKYGYEIMNLHDYEPCGNVLHLEYFIHGQREGENIDVVNNIEDARS